MISSVYYYDMVVTNDLDLCSGVLSPSISGVFVSVPLSSDV
jgi:hypothetical protein